MVVLGKCGVVVLACEECHTVCVDKPCTNG